MRAGASPSIVYLSKALILSILCVNKKWEVFEQLARFVCAVETTQSTFDFKANSYSRVFGWFQRPTKTCKQTPTFSQRVYSLLDCFSQTLIESGVVFLAPLEVLRCKKQATINLFKVPQHEKNKDYNHCHLQLDNWRRLHYLQLAIQICAGCSLVIMFWLATFGF